MALALALSATLLLSLASTAAAQVRHRVVVVAPFYPWYPYYPYPYPYGGYYVPNVGELKVDPQHQKNDAVYIDGGYAATISKSKKFSLRPGNHELEVRNAEGQTVLKEQVAVSMGQTTKVQVPS
jgi:hypothetical protein